MKIDAIAFHFYGTDPEAFVRYATVLRDTYGKPIWVTEFADEVGFQLHCEVGVLIVPYLTS